MGLLACGSDDGSERQQGGFLPDQTCGLRVELSGALAASLSGEDTESACVHPLGPDGIHNTFLPIAGNLGAFQLDVAGVAKGATGADFAAQVRLTSRDKRVWNTTDCTVSVTEHKYVRTGEFGDQYRVVGSGGCQAPLTSVSGQDGTVAIGPFDFVVVTSWLGSD